MRLPKRSGQRRWWVLGMATAAAALPMSARATVTFESTSTARIDLDPGTGVVYAKNVNPPPLSANMPRSPEFQFGRTTNGTTGDLTLGAVSTSTITGFTLAPGSGVAQSPSATGTADLSVRVNGTWDVSRNFGPTATGYVSFNLAGTTDSSGSAQATVSFSFSDGSGNVLRAPINQTFNFGKNQNFALPYTDDVAFSPTSLGNGSKVHIQGSIDFKADPSTVQLSDFEFSAAPPTATYVGDFDDTGWYTAANWTANTIPGVTSNPIATGFPNGIGQRARFVGPAVDSTLIISQPTTLGTLDIDQDGVTIQTDFAPLIFDVNDGNGLVLIRNVHANGIHNIYGQIQLNKTIEVENDCAGTLQLAGTNGTISGPGGMIINGLGPVLLNGSDTFQGGFVLNAGAVYAVSAGALGTGSVTVNGGLLKYGTNGLGNGMVPVNSGGQVEMAVPPSAADVFNVADLGCISGPAANLAAFNSNLTLTKGAIIGHESFDTGAVNNPANIGTTPLYNFGISTDFKDPSAFNIIAVGSNTISPWIGFGGDTMVRTFGSNPTDTTHQLLVVSGDAQIVSIGSALVMNAPIDGGGGTLTKRGAGVVQINNTHNTFNGPVVVQSGPMAVNGNFSPASVTVNSGATLAGSGTINSSVTVENGGHISPGSVGPTPTFASSPVPEADPGTLHTGSLFLNPTSQLDYNLDQSSASSLSKSNTAILRAAASASSNDLIAVQGDVQLAGQLNVIDGPNFDPAGTYTLMDFTGSIDNLGITLGNSVELDPREQVDILLNATGGGGSVVLEPTGVAPEPTAGLAMTIAAVCLLFRRARAIRNN